MIWGSPSRQYAILAAGARTFALLIILVPIILDGGRQTDLLAVLALGSVWVATTAGERLNVPTLLILVLEAASIGAAAGLATHTTLTVLQAMAVPPFTAGLRRGTRGVTLALSAELVVLVILTTLGGGHLNQVQGVAAFTWSVMGLGLGMIASFVRTGSEPPGDPLEAYRDAQSLIRELIGLSGELSSGLDPVALAGRIASIAKDEMPVVVLNVHVPRGDELTPVISEPAPDLYDQLTVERLTRECWGAGAVRVDGSRFAFPLKTGVTNVAVVSGVLSPGLDPDEIGLDSFLEELGQRLETNSVHLDTALLFAELRDAATVEERRRLAREMHDGVAQEMASLGYFLDSLMVGDLPEDHLESLAMLRERLTQVVGEVRRSVQTLRTSIGENESLGTAIGSIARHLSASSGIPIHVTLDEGTTRLRPSVESELLRITQEAMTNAVRHAGANNIEVRCAVAPPAAEIVIADDGVGLQEGRPDSHGLEIMQERANLIDADLFITDRPPHGTVVCVRIIPDHGVSDSRPATRQDTLTA